MLTHENFIADITGGMKNGVEPVETDIHVSYLPLAHVFERIVMNTVLSVGGAAGFYRGDVRKLFDDIECLQPTLFVSVPRLWNRLYDKVMGTIQTKGAIVQTLFETAYETKRDGLQEGRSFLFHSPATFSDNL